MVRGAVRGQGSTLSAPLCSKHVEGQPRGQAVCTAKTRTPSSRRARRLGRREPQAWAGLGGGQLQPQSPGLPWNKKLLRKSLGSHIGHSSQSA